MTPARALLLLLAVTAKIALAAEPPPTRPLPVPSARPLNSAGPSFFVDAAKGDDAAAGTEAAPWKTLRHALARLHPGETLVLRGGVYFEHSVLSVRGTADKPVTLRSHPGEIAILDGGIPQFQLTPATSWEPVANGAPGEFRSTFPISRGDGEGGTEPADATEGDGEGGGEKHTNAFGNFVANMVPLQGYHFVADLRSKNEYFSKLESTKTAAGAGIYCGPGVYLDAATRRMHVRLAHTDQTCLGDENYRGETDPRRVPLVVSASSKPTLTLQDCSHVVLQDLVLRGAFRATLDMQECANITLDGVTVFGGATALRIAGTTGLRCVDCAFRGIAAPWTWRGSLKYRAIESRIISASPWTPHARVSRDFEFARCEFTDSVDGVFIGNVDDVAVHHCLLDNISDDGFFVTCRTAFDGTTPGGNVRVLQNVLSRCLTTFAFGVGHGRQKTIGPGGAKAVGSGLFIGRNVFDMRRPVHYQQPGPGETEIKTFGRFAGDHGSPAWEPMTIFHNTFLNPVPPFRGYYGGGTVIAMGKGTRRAVLNNVFVQFTGDPADVMPEGDVALTVDGNVHWSLEAGDAGSAAFLKRLRTSPRFATTHWTEHDRYGDPKFAAMPTDWRARLDVTPQADSAAIGTAVAIDKSWPDPLRDSASSDAGAIAHDGKPWRVGVRGRLDAFGNPLNGAMNEADARASGISPFKHGTNTLPAADRPRAALVIGYPAFDAPILRYALEARGLRVDEFDKRWLPVEQFKSYRVVAVVGDLARAKMEPNHVSAAEAPLLNQWLNDGGVLLLGRGTASQVFAGEDAAPLFSEITGIPRDATRLSRVPFQPAWQAPGHEWIKHLSQAPPPAWASRNATLLRLTRGESIIGDAQSRSVLARIPFGKGQVLHVGWTIADSLPAGRKPSTVEQEATYEAQYAIVEKMLESALKP